MDHQFKIGASDCSNSAPLAWFIPRVNSQGEMIWDTPSSMVERLLSGALDMALVPVAGLLRNPSLTMVAPLGVCADGLVKSVLLKCHRPLEDTSCVKTDRASQTSNALTGILLKHHFKVDARLEKECLSPDAEVMIGDRAMCAPPAENGDYDLAAEWKKMTGLPFVFAVWACRADHPDKGELASIAHEAWICGRKNLPLLSRAYAERLKLGEDFCRNYLTSVIHYELANMELQAIKLFGRLLGEMEESKTPTAGAYDQDYRNKNARTGAV